MAKELTPDEAIARARALQDERLHAIRAVAVARQNVTDVREASARELAELQARIAQRISQAERDDVRAYNAAVTAGWTPDELRKIGFGEPDKKARVRRRAARRTSPTTRPTDAGTDAGTDAQAPAPDVIAGNLEHAPDTPVDGQQDEDLVHA